MRISASSQVEYLRQNFSDLANRCQPLWHPLGFVSCIVRDEPGLCVVRIHYWPKNERRPKRSDWPIHTHVYDLSSLILLGRVRDIQYQTKHGSEYEVYSVSYARDGSSINHTGRDLSLEVLVDEYHAVGEEYWVPVGSFHQTYVPINESAITLVALSNFQSAHPLVLGHEGDEVEPYTQRPFEKEPFWEYVDQAFTQLIGKAS